MQVLAEIGDIGDPSGDPVFSRRGTTTRAFDMDALGPDQGDDIRRTVERGIPGREAEQPQPTLGLDLRDLAAALDNAHRQHVRAADEFRDKG